MTTEEDVAEDDAPSGKRVLDFSGVDRADFFSRLFGKARGWVAVATGPQPKRVDHMIKWPEDAETLLNLDGSRGAFFRPVLRQTRNLSDRGGLKGSLPTDVWSLWVDLDEPITDEIRADVDSLGGLIVWSGSPGHCHIYLPLQEGVDVEHAEAWNYALKEHWPGGDHKWRDDGTWLRLPGSTHHSGAIVTVEPLTSNRRVTEDALEALCGPVRPERSSRVSSHDDDAIGREELPRDFDTSKRYQGVRTLLDRPCESDRSGASWALVQECLKAGLTIEQTASVLARHVPTVDRAEDRGVPIDVDLRRMWTKAAPPDVHSTPAQETSKGRLMLVPSSDLKAKPVVWLWKQNRGRIPAGMLTVAIGLPGAGKSQFAMWIAARVSRGELSGAFEGKPRSVIYFTTEDNFNETIKPRLIAAGEDQDRVFILRAKPGINGLSLPDDLDELEQLITSNDVALVILDPLISAMNQSLDDNQARHVRRALEPLRDMMERTGVAVLGIGHMNKSGTDPLARFSGSAAFSQLIRSALSFAVDADHGICAMDQEKNNLDRRDDVSTLAYVIEERVVRSELGRTATSCIVFTGYEAPRSVKDIYVAEARLERSTRTTPSLKATAAEWLSGYLKHQGGSAWSTDVIEAGKAQDFTESTVRAAATHLGVKRSKERGVVNGRWTWTLPS